LIGAGAANGQSFDCRKARSADEFTICQESGLAQLDQELRSLKRQRKEKHHKAERDDADDNETAFLNARRRCGESRACIEQSYRNRIQERTRSSPEEDREQPSRASANAKRSERRNGSTEEGQRSQERLTAPSETHPGASETAIEPAERKTEQSEPRPPAASPPFPPEAHSRHQPVGTGSQVPTPPSREEAQAAIVGVPVPEKHNRHKEGANIGSARPARSPEHDKPPTSAGTALQEGHTSASVNSTADEPPAKPQEKRRAKAAAIAAPPAAEREVQPTGTSTAAVERQRSNGETSRAESAGNEPQKRQTKRSASATAQSADEPVRTGAPTIKWVNPAARALSETAAISAADRATPSPASLRERDVERYACCCIRSARRLAMVGAFGAFSGF
jgi:hypothetical protein